MGAILIASAVAGIGLFVAFIHSKVKESAQQRGDEVRSAAERCDGYELAQRFAAGARR